VHLAVYLPLPVPLAAALSAGRLARRLDPRLATWLLTCSALVLAAATTTVLSVLVVAGLIQIPLIARLAKLSLQVIHHDRATSTSVALLAAIALSTATTAAARMIWRRARALLVAADQARCLPGSGLRSRHHWFTAAVQLAAAPPERLGQTMGAAELGRKAGDAGGPLLVGAIAATASLSTGMITLSVVVAATAAGVLLRRGGGI
jgi:hypothetical protein